MNRTAHHQPRQGRKRVLVVGVFLGLLLGLAPSQALAQEAPLERAWSLFQQGKPDEARRLLRDLMPGLQKAEELRDAYLIRGACAFVANEPAAAEREIIIALSYDPDYRADALRLSPDLQALVQRIAVEKRPAILRLTEERRAAQATSFTHPRETTSDTEKQTPPKASLPSTSPAASSPAPARSPRPPGTPPRLAPPDQERLISTPLYLALLPLGVGQFANDQHTKGWLFLSSESLLLLSSLGCLVAALALRDEEGRYVEARMDTARALNITYLTTGYSALALMIIGAVDGAYFHNRRHRRTARDLSGWTIGLGPQVVIQTRFE